MFPLSGAMEISYAAKRAVTPTGGGGEAICVQVMPPSVLRQIPPPFAVRKSSPVVAITMLGSAGTYATAYVQYADGPSMCRHVVPPFVLLNRPPDSDATIMVAALLGCTAIVFARPPLAMSGWNSERVQPKKSHCAAAFGDEKRKKRTERE